MSHSPSHLTCEYLHNPLGIDTPSPRFSWWMDDARPGAAQTAYRVQVAADPSFSHVALVWDSGEIESSGSVLIEYAGAPLASRTRYHYRVRIRDHQEQWSSWSEVEWFETAFLDEREWQAQWIGPSDEDALLAEEARAGGGSEADSAAGQPAAPSAGPASGGAPAPFLRRGFSLDAPPLSARLYVAARGLCEMSINGERVGDAVLSPGWTDYDFRCQYLTCEVTDLLREGENAIGAILGDGWYSGRIARVHDRERRFGARPQLLCELHVVTSAGETAIASDGEWVWRTGPVLASDIYDGEAYDARAELPGWSEPGAEEAGWEPVRVVGPALAGWDGSTGERPPRLDAKVVPPVRRIREITPRPGSEPEPGRYVYDLGQNISGWARISLDLPEGTTVTLRFAEMLNPDGTLYVENLRSAKATDAYTAAGGPFTWEPRFTFHGFRYIELSGLESAPKPGQVIGVVLHNDLEETGTFECSNALVNKLQSNIEWGQRGNYLEAPTDCPQRDERLGWTGDAQVFIPTAAFNMNVAPFFTKWQRDLVDAQGPEGTIPSIAPAIRYMKPSEAVDGGPAWSDAFVICPWTIRARYGDRRIIEAHYDAMYRFVESMRSRSRGLIRSDEYVVPWGGFGDWVSMDAPEGSKVGATPKDLIGTAYFAYSTDLLRRMAELLGRASDVLQLRDLHRRIVAAFRSEYVTAGGRVLGDTQTSYAVALAFDLLPEEQRPAALDRLVRQLERRRWRLSTGFVGTNLLCPVLTRFGREDVAYRLLLQEEFPSWLYTVNQGATTMWERWNSYTHEHGFGPVDMNSFNHYAYGAIGDWIYSSVAGLRVDMSEPGEAPIRIAPRPGYGIESASAELTTPFGRAASSWSIGGGKVSLEVTIPANAWAEVVVPAGLSDIEIDADEGESSLEELVVHEGSDGGDFRFRVAAGAYVFRWRAAVIE